MSAALRKVASTPFTLAALLDAHLSIDHLRTGVNRAEGKLTSVDDQIPGAQPARLAELCRTLSIVHIHVDGQFDVAIALRPMLEALDPAQQSDEARAIVLGLLAELRSLSKRVLALRARLRALDELLAKSIGRLRSQSAEMRLRRILKPGTTLSLEDLETAVRHDHIAVHEAHCAWRFIHDSHPFMSIVDATSDEDLIQGVRILVARGFLEPRLTLRGRRWTVA
jgi:hypothetical protein